MDKRLRVLLIVHHRLDPNAGAAGATVSLGQALSQLGCYVEYFSFDDAFPNLAKRTSWHTLLFPWRVALHLARHGSRFDVVDASSGDAWVWALFMRSRSGLGPALATRVHGLEHTVDLHLREERRRGAMVLSWKYFLYNGRFRLFEVGASLRAADRCIFLNEEDRQFATKNLRVKERRTSVVPNGVGDHFRDQHIERAENDVLRLAALGSWLTRKGKRVLVETAAELEARGLSFSLTLIGTGASASTVLAEFPPPVRGRVSVVPDYANVDLPRLLRSHHILMAPSLAEGFNIALLEAMACGLVPVSTDAGVAASVITNGINGLLVPKRDALAMADRVEYLDRDRASLDQMRGTAQDSIRPYRWEEIASKTAALYRQSLHRGGQATDLGPHSARHPLAQKPVGRPSFVRLFPIRTLIGIGHDLLGAARVTRDLRSFWRLARDMALYRVLKVVHLSSKGQERCIGLSDGTNLTYRLDRGDIQSIREVWIEERYRLPFELQVERVVDLGAHIGLASLWLAKRYSVESVLAVEPDTANARLARKNLRENCVDGQVVNAAVHQIDGTGLFVASPESNLGTIAANDANGAGAKVRLISMASVLRRFEGESVDLLKMDIEGSEEIVLGEDCTWLESVRALIAEFHPDLVDYPGLVRRVEQEGFTYVPAGSVNRRSADAFIRAA